MPRNCGERWVDTTQRLQLMNGKKTTSKLSVLPTFHTQGTTPTTPQSRYKREEKHFKISFWKAFLEWSSAAASTDGPRQPPHSSFLLWEPVMMRSRSKPRSYKCVTRTDLNPSHIHGISFCSWESPGNWNRTFQLYIRDVKPFKKGGNLEHSQKLYIKLKKINQYIYLHLHNSAKLHSKVLILAHWNRSWSAPAQLAADVIF